MTRQKIHKERREAHEKLAARKCRERRLDNGELSATYVVLAWKERLRMAYVAKMTPGQHKDYFG